MAKKIIKWLLIAVFSIIAGAVILVIDTSFVYTGLSCREQGIVGRQCTISPIVTKFFGIVNFPYMIASFASLWFRKVFPYPPGPPYTRLALINEWLWDILYFGLWILIGFVIYTIYQKRKNSPN